MTRSSRSAESIETPPEPNSATSARRTSPPRSNTSRAPHTIGLILLCAAACGPCDDKPSAERASAAEPRRTKRELLELRLAEQRPDPSKTYAKLDDGSTDCGKDVKCFAVHADRCEPALLERDDRIKALLLHHRVHARYRIAGLQGARCTVQRAVIAAEALLIPGTLESLKAAGQTSDGIEKIRVDSQAELTERHPPRLTCELSRDSALELALDLAEKQPVGAHFLDDCQQPAADDEWPASLVVAAVVAAPDSQPDAAADAPSP
jgi:hypothetical protein